MKTKETTPPSLRTFNIELNENELRILAILVGKSSTSEFNFSHQSTIEELKHPEIEQYYADYATGMYHKLAQVFTGE